MQDKRRAQTGCDQGFTVAEVVISMAILFFAVTALLGLLSTNTSMTATSKSKSVLTNSIAAELDSIRALPYEQIALTTADPPGVIEPTKSIMKYGFTVTLSFDITERTATKEVRVSGLARRDGFPDTRTSSFAAIRDRIGGTKPGDEDEASGPMVEFTAATPAADSILTGVNIYNGGTIVIGAHAQVAEANINKIDMSVTIPLVGSRPLKNGNTVYSDPSGWEGTPASDVTYSFNWDTRQIEKDAPFDPEVPDGRRTVTITAFDDQERASASKSRAFIVDNYPPGLATGLTAAVRGLPDLTQYMTQSWTSALDGDNLAAPAHELEIYRNTNGAALLSSWSQVGDAYASPTTVTVDALSEYAYRVRAHSYSNRLGEWAQSSPVITRPVLTGYYNATYSSSAKKWTYTQYLTVPRAESFWSSISILLETDDEVAGVSTTDITNAVKTAWNAGQPYNLTQTWTSAKLTGGKIAFPPTYRLRVSVTPNGYGGGTAVAVNSNTAKAADLAPTASSPRNSQPFLIGW